jgi:hypothetical protein
MICREMPSRQRVILLTALLLLLSIAAVPLFAAVAQPAGQGYHLAPMTSSEQDNVSTGGRYLLTGLAYESPTFRGGDRTYALEAFQIEGLLSNPCVYLPIASKNR